MKIRLVQAADQELSDATAFLAAKSEGLALRFLDEIGAARALLLRFPKAGEPLRGGLRRLIIGRFPYQLVYRVEGDEIRVYAVAHLKRKPAYWRKRVK